MTKDVEKDRHATTDAVALVKWQNLQSEIRHLALQRALRFVAACILAPFGVADTAGPGGGRVSGWAFGIALLLLAIAEGAALAQAALQHRDRKELEKEHPELAPHRRPTRWARTLGFVSGPPLSTALYALLGAAVLVANDIQS